MTREDSDGDTGIGLSVCLPASASSVVIAAENSSSYSMTFLIPNHRVEYITYTKYMQSKIIPWFSWYKTTKIILTKNYNNN